jgi:integrase
MARKQRVRAEGRQHLMHLVIPERVEKLDVAAKFRSYLQIHAPADPEGKVFVKTQGDRWSDKGITDVYVNEKIRLALTDAQGLAWSKERAKGCSAHSFRHGAATDRALGGASQAATAAVLGHKRVDTQLKYVGQEAAQRRRCLGGSSSLSSCT